MATAFDRQIQNRNFLSPVGFKFVLGKHPKVDFEKLNYGDFSLTFLVDENMENYSILHKWLKRLGFAATTEDYQKLITDRDGQRDPKEAFSDGTLQVLSSNFQPIIQVKFVDLFPISLSSLTFDVSDTDVQYFTAEASFRYTIFEINDMFDKEL